MDKLFIEAVSQLGEKEITGPEDNPTIVNYAKESGFGWVDDELIKLVNLRSTEALPRTQPLSK